MSFNYILIATTLFSIIFFMSCIAIGGLLPGICGSFTKFGYVEVLYVTELIGICFIYAGYIVIKNGASTSVHANQAIVPPNHKNLPLLFVI